MKEETAQESSFTSIFKDYAGRWWSENVAFIATTAVCLFIALQASVVDSTLILVGAFTHVNLEGGTGIYNTCIIGLIGTLQGIGAYKKNQATKLVFNKELRNKEIEQEKENAQPASN